MQFGDCRERPSLSRTHDWPKLPDAASRFRNRRSTFAGRRPDGTSFQRRGRLTASSCRRFEQCPATRCRCFAAEFAPRSRLAIASARRIRDEDAKRRSPALTSRNRRIVSTPVFPDWPGVVDDGDGVRPQPDGRRDEVGQWAIRLCKVGVFSLQAMARANFTLTLGPAQLEERLVGPSVRVIDAGVED